MIHAIITTVIALAVVLLNGQEALCFLPALFYLGREHAQAEQRYIDTHGGYRNKCPWYCGFLPQSWNLKGMLDWILPMAGSSLAVVLSLFL